MQIRNERKETAAANVRNAKQLYGGKPHPKAPLTPSTHHSTADAFPIFDDTPSTQTPGPARTTSSTRTTTAIRRPRRPRTARPGHRRQRPSTPTRTSSRPFQSSPSPSPGRRARSRATCARGRMTRTRRPGGRVAAHPEGRRRASRRPRSGSRTSRPRGELALPPPSHCLACCSEAFALRGKPRGRLD